MRADFVVRNDLRLLLFAIRFRANLRRVSNMVIMAMGEENMGDPFRDLGELTLETGISLQKRIDQKRRCADFHTKGRMAKSV